MTYDQDVRFKTVRSKRKTIAIAVLKDGTVELRLPLRTPVSAAADFLKEKQAWVLQKQREVLALSETKKQFALQEGVFLWFLGNQYPIQEGSGNDTVFDGNTFVLPKKLSLPERKQAAISLYRSLAEPILADKTAYFARLMNASYSKIAIHNSHAQWGSCTGENKIYYAWKLIFAPPDLVDYVVVHELSHTLFHDHSKRFWNRVQDTLPDYEERRSRLRAFAKKIQCQDWESPGKS